MTERTAAKVRSSYGVDAPYVLLGLAGGVIAAAFLTAVLALTIGWSVAWISLLAAVAMLVQLGFFWYATTKGKFQAWEQVLHKLALRGDEQLLDMGCGRGAVVLRAARRLNTGRAVGVDLWRTVDQSGNTVAAAERNAIAEGVADRVELRTGDMTNLPLGDAEFDIVVSSLAIHNIKTVDGRAQAIDEAVRVLRPAGRLAIADISNIDEYRQRLTKLGMADVQVRSLGWRMWWGGPWMNTHLVSATKPAS